MASVVEPEGTSVRSRSPDRSARRWLAFLLSVLTPGVGHLAIGHPRRMVAWFATLLVILAVTVAGSLAGAPGTIVIAVAASVILRVGAALDTLRLERSQPLPRLRAVMFIIVGLFAFWNIVAASVRSHVIEAFKIPSEAMAPTLLAGDHIFATKLDRTYRRGDVVVFRYPLDREVKYVKRIVAMGGDLVSIRDGALFINGRPVPRQRIARSCGSHDEGACLIWQEQLGGHAYEVMYEAYGNRPVDEILVPPGAFFVLGDNRDNSSDSRIWGSVDAALIEGKVTGVWWSQTDVIHWDRMNLRTN